MPAPVKDRGRFFYDLNNLMEGMNMDAEELQNKVYALVEKSQGKKKLKPKDISNAMEAEGATQAETKAALRVLIDGGKLVYSYFGGTAVEIPHTEGSANPQS
jgi:YbbR domain-containing protein